MKLGIKLPLAFAFSLGLLLAGALFGIFKLNQAIHSYEDDALQHVAAHKMAADISGDFAVAIQEWKNVLLRGKDSKDMEKYWNAHLKEMKQVNDGIQKLQGMVDAGHERDTVQKLATAMLVALGWVRQSV